MAMYVCICNKVTEKEIKRAFRSGANSMLCLQEQLAVATCCGKCHGKAKACLDSLLTPHFGDALASSG